MKEAIVLRDVTVSVRDAPIPVPKNDEVLIKVIVVGANPKDWKVPVWINVEANEGDDIAGYVHAIGPKVNEFKVGDRVAAMHEMLGPGGGYAEYAIAPEHTTFHIPKETSFEEAATIPLAALTAVVALYASSRLSLPSPWTKPTSPLPLLVYGGASAVGAFAIKMAVHSGIHPIITVAGNGIPYVQTLIDPSKGDAIIDYRKGNEQVIKGIKEALQGRGLYHVLDCVVEDASKANIGAVVTRDKETRITPVHDIKADGVYEGLFLGWSQVADVHGSEKELAFVWSRLFYKGLVEGWFKPHPHQVVPGGLGGIETALGNLRAGKASAVKYLFRIAETEGVSP